MISDEELAEFQELSDRLLDAASDGRPLAPDEVETIAASVRDAVDALVAVTHAALVAKERIATLEHLCGSIGRMVKASQIPRGDRLGRAVILSLVENDILAEPEPPPPPEPEPPTIGTSPFGDRRGKPRNPGSPPSSS